MMSIRYNNHSETFRLSIGKATVAGLLVGLCGSATGAAPATAPAAMRALGAAVESPARSFPDDAGLVDVKARYGAKGDGRTDDTAAIQKGIDETKQRFRTLYFPPGTYLISDKLSYGDNKETAKQFAIQGAGRDQSVIRLKDNAKGFDNADKPKPLLTMFEGGSTGMAFFNSIWDISFDIGKGNAGASGVQWMNNNVGAMENVAIRSSDPKHAGAIGLDLTKTEPGPALFRNVTIDGFDVGLKANPGPFSTVFEHITFRDQQKVAIENKYHTLTMRSVLSENAVPFAITTTPQGMITLIDSKLVGRDVKGPAIQSKGLLYLRNVDQQGYATFIENTQGEGFTGTHIDEYVSATGKASSAFGQTPDKAKSLNLPIEEAPEIPWDAAENWVRVDTSKEDDAPAAQTAIDLANKEGKHTVYFPGADADGAVTFGSQVRVYGSVRRVIGMDNVWKVTDEFNEQGKAIFRVEDVDSEAIVFERFTPMRWKGSKFYYVDHQTPKTLIMRHINTYGGRPYTGGVKGSRVFLENIGGSSFVFNGQKVWARQINPEGNSSPNYTNNGGDLWILGLKTENGGATVISTTDGGRTELIGGQNYSSWKPLDGKLPMFIVENSLASFVIGNLSFDSKRGYDVAIRETRDGQTKDLTIKDANAGGRGHAGSLLLITAGQ